MTSRLERIRLAFLVWTGLAVLSIIQAAMAFSERGQPVRWGFLIPSRLIDWYTCAIFTPVLLWLVRRFPLDAAQAVRRVPIYVVVTAACVVAKYALLTTIISFAAPGEMTLAGALAQNFMFELMIFWAAVGVLHAWDLRTRLAEREQTALELRARLSEAQLQVLRGQLRPHFLFNALNGVASLIHTAPETADFIVVQLADLLRASLDHDGTREIPLDEELALLDKYLAIMRARFGDRVAIAKRIDPGAARALVPEFLLQPLVENAFEHGVGQRSGPGTITIGAQRADDGRLRIEITDDGPGLTSAATAEGVGLGHSRRRLAQLYGEAQSLALLTLPGGGAMAAVELPFRTA